MSYPRPYPTGTGDNHVDERDYNALRNILLGFTPSGVFRSPYSYLIDFDGTDYYANNAYQIIYGGPSDAGGVDGADLHAVLVAALGSGFNTLEFTTGKTLLLPKTLDIPKSSVLRGSIYPSYNEDDNPSVIRAAPGFVGTKLFNLLGDANPTEYWHSTIAGLELDGANVAGGIDGVYLNKYSRLNLLNNRIRRFTGNGVHAVDVSGVGNIFGNHIIGNTLYGIHGEAGFADNIITNNYLVSNGYSGVRFANGSNHNILAHNKIEWNTVYGVAVVQSSGIQILGNNIDKNGWSGVKVITAEGAAVEAGVLIDDNYFFQNGENDEDHIAHVTVQSYPRVQISNNEFRSDLASGYPTYCVKLVSVTNAIVTDNDFTGGCTGNKISSSSVTTSIIRDNLGWVTENWGLATLAAGNTFVDVTHGLAAQPTNVQVTPYASMETRTWWVDTLGAATFRINMTAISAATAYFFWYARWNGLGA